MENGVSELPDRFLEGTLTEIRQSEIVVRDTIVRIGLHGKLIVRLRRIQPAQALKDPAEIVIDIRSMPDVAFVSSRQAILGNGLLE